MGHGSTVKLSINNSAYKNLCKKTGENPLFIACKNGNDSIVQLLLKHGADVNFCTEEGVTPLGIAVHKSTK